MEDISVSRFTRPRQPSSLPEEAYVPDCKYRRIIEICRKMIESSNPMDIPPTKLVEMCREVIPLAEEEDLGPRELGVEIAEKISALKQEPGYEWLSDSSAPVLHLRSLDAVLMNGLRLMYRQLVATSTLPS